MGNSVAKLAALDFGIQLLAFLPSSYFQTERFYDLTGSCTFLLLSRMGLHLSQQTFRHKVQANLISAWALRLGSFLFYRVMHEGGDRRFEKVRVNPSIFFKYWMMQGVWVFLTMLPSLLNNENKQRLKPKIRDYVGWGMFGAGFLIEVIADYQKLKFRNNPDNAGKFISHGLWSISRHPNYFGEILLWSGLFVSASSSFDKNWQWISILSPLFNYYLLTRVSGIPILERSGLKRYGHLPAYQEYIKNVPELVPFFGKP